MKLNSLFMMGALSALALAGCKDNDDNSLWGNTEDIVFNSRISSIQTKASGNAWSDGDEVGIFMQTESAEFANKKYLAKSTGALTAAPGEALRYPESGSSSFLAYYPYSNSLNGKELPVAVKDQSKPEAIDLLYSNNASNIAKDAPVTLEFSHQLSQLVLNVSSDETITSLNGLKITLKGMNTTATFNLNDGKLTPADSKADIDLKVNAEGTLAEAIILPTAATDGATLTFTLGDKTFDWAVTTPENKGFEKGCKYTYNATLSTENGKPSIKMGDATITDWVDKAGGDINVDFGEGGGEQPGGEQVLIDEAFNTSQGAFTIQNVTLPEGSTYVWQWSTYQETQYMKASANINKVNHAAESWLVSPAVDLTAAESATLTFDHCHKFGADKTKEMTLWVAENGTAVSKEATGWTQIAIPTYGSGNDYQYVKATVDLSAYKGKNIQFAFRYISTDQAAALWQIDAVKVVANGQGGVSPEPDPDPEPEPGEEATIFLEGFGTPEKIGNYWPNVAAENEETVYKGWENANLTFTDPTWTPSEKTQYSNTSVRSTSTLNGHVWLPAKKESALRIAGFDVANYSGLKLSYQITANESGNQNVIKVSTDKGDVTVPDVTIAVKNQYQAVELSLPNGITYIQFTGTAATNTAGYRIDDVKLVGTAK